MLRPVRASRFLPAVLALAACASDLPRGTEPDFSGERIDVRVMPRGFASFCGERVPLEECILVLRRRVRAMPRSDRGSIWIRLSVERKDDPQLGRDRERLLEELGHLGIRQIEIVP